MFLLVSVRHVGAHPDELQHGVSIQSLINLGKTFPRISRIRIIPSTQILARVFVYLPPDQYLLLKTEGKADRTAKGWAKIIVTPSCSISLAFNFK